MVSLPCRPPPFSKVKTNAVPQKLYQRSKTVEPTGAAGGGATDLKKKTMGFLRGS